MQKTEIFRHLRPHWYDRRKHQLVPQPMGGFSFILVPRAEQTYDFWIYICPEDAPFSSKQAVMTLRERVSNGIVPFGTIELNDAPLIQQLTKYLITEMMALPSEASKQALTINLINSFAERKLRLREQASNATRHYSE